MLLAAGLIGCTDDGAETDAEVRVAAESAATTAAPANVSAAATTRDAALEAAFETRRGLAQIEVSGHRPQMRFGVHSGKPRRLGGDYFGVDVNVAARVMEAAKPDQVLISDATCEGILLDRFALSRAKRLKAPGAPGDLHVIAIDPA